MKRITTHLISIIIFLIILNENDYSAQSLVINEAMSSNTSTLSDEDSDTPLIIIILLITKLINWSTFWGAGHDLHRIM